MRAEFRRPARLSLGWLSCLTLVLYAALTAACAAPRREATPQASLRAFAGALQQGDLKGAYALLSNEARASLSFDDFQKQIAGNPAEAKALTQALKRRLTARTYATVTLSDASEVALEKKGDRWQIATPLSDFYPQGSPQQALDSFIRAVERGRWDVVLDLMPEADRQGLDAATLGENLKAQEEELTRMVALLKASRESPIEIVGDRATMPYGESFTARFVRENGVWKVEDPE